MGVLTNPVKNGGIVWDMLRTHSLEDGRLKSRRFVEFLVLKNSQSFTHDLTLIGVAAGVHETLHKL